MKKIFLILCILFFQVWAVFSYTQADLKLQYDKIYLNIQKKANYNNDKVVSVLKVIDSRLKIALSKTSKQSNKNLLNTLISLNDTKLKSLTTIQFPDFIEKMTKNGYTFLKVWDNLELYDNWWYRFTFKKYYEINSTNYNYFLTNKLNWGIIIKYKNNYIITNDYKKEKKYTYKELEKVFKNYYDSLTPYFLNNWVYYSYKYSYYIYFDNIDWVYLSDLEANKIDLNNTLYIKNWDKYYFSNNYEKIRLVSENIISNISNKNEFIYNLADDNKFISWNYDEILSQIKSTTNTIVSWINSNDEKIKIIYKWIVDNIIYYQNYSDGNKQIYSWILTYKNKTWVCDWYTKLFVYMLSFAWVTNVEVKRWYAFDSSDFPNFWHAWVKIWNTYYDPTFDDPIWWDGKNDFYYFSIPYELMYINRFDGLVIPEIYKNMSLDNRKNLVIKNMYNLYEKYKYYPLMNKIKNKIFLWLKYDEKINLEILSKKIPYFEVNNSSFLTDWNKKTIKSLNYYLINDKNIEDIVLNPKINLEGMYLFKWRKTDWTFDFRLSYDLVIN